jgi:uncharacterized membrane protein YfcA
MTAVSLVALALIYFLIALVTVVTGSTTLITVPVMLQFGIEPRTAVATNMLALTLLSFGGLLPFIGTPSIDKPRAPLLVLLTLAGSAAGALLLFAVPAKWMTLIIPVAMIGVLVLLLVEPPEYAVKAVALSPTRARLGYVVMALLSIYGGFLSGGYATLLTVAGIVFFRYSLLRGIAMSRMLNTASSLIAVVVFTWYRIIDWRLGIALSLAGFLGGWMGSHWAQKMRTKLLRQLFIAAVAALALKALIFDVPWRELTAISLPLLPVAVR